MEIQNMKFETLQKATEMAMWMTFTHRKYTNGQHAVFLNNETREFEVKALRDKIEPEYIFLLLPENHSQMTYSHFKTIYSDPDPLEHWKKIMVILSEIDEELLRFLVNCQIPLEKLIQFELSRTIQRYYTGLVRTGKQ